MKRGNSVSMTHSINLILGCVKEDSMNSRKRKVIPWFESVIILSSLLF